MIVYSIGIGIPFVLSVILIDKIKGVFAYIKKNFEKIKKISGVILVCMGIYVMFF